MYEYSYATWLSTRPRQRGSRLYLASLPRLSLAVPLQASSSASSATVRSLAAARVRSLTAARSVHVARDLPPFTQYRCNRGP